jgi:ABC-2 type transport system permease protein
VQFVDLLRHATQFSWPTIITGLLALAFGLGHTRLATLASLVALVVLVWGLGVPLFGSIWRLGVTRLLLALASVGLGFALSLLAASERQAVHFSMLALLTVVFFSGFPLPLDQLRQPALTVSYVLPATYGGCCRICCCAARRQTPRSSWYLR